MTLEEFNREEWADNPARPHPPTRLPPRVQRELAAVRSELTWEGAMPPPLKPVGDCIITEAIDGSLHIDRADPRIIISAELLGQIRDGIGRWATLNGDILKIVGTNRTVVYRIISEKVPKMEGYYAEWPD